MKNKKLCEMIKKEIEKFVDEMWDRWTKKYVKKIIGD
jgi:hypothetical protein